MKLSKRFIVLCTTISLSILSSVPASASNDFVNKSLLTQEKNSASQEDTIQVENNITKGNLIQTSLLKPITTFLSENKIYGDNGFRGINSIGVNTDSFDAPNAKDIQINSYASRDSGSNSGDYLITLQKKGFWGYSSLATSYYPITTNNATYVGTWSGVGTGTYRVNIRLQSGDPDTISGGISVYEKF
ncbi:hypothetical protein [Paenibacillus sp. RC84]|uniref:hypothetical protein n=1 Tax=Paenibacillus sp. RC84 TaxID=3156252 RepID=UPI003517ECA9